jgi:hypothetical protein
MNVRGRLRAQRAMLRHLSSYSSHNTVYMTLLGTNSWPRSSHTRPSWAEINGYFYYYVIRNIKRVCDPDRDSHFSDAPNNYSQRLTRINGARVSIFTRVWVRPPLQGQDLNTVCSPLVSHLHSIGVSCHGSSHARSYTKTTRGSSSLRTRRILDLWLWIQLM